MHEKIGVEMRKMMGRLNLLIRPLENSRGILLLTTYFLIAVVSIFSLALFARSNVFLQTTERNQNRVVAFNMAEAGMDQAMKALEGDLTYAGAGYTSLATSTVRGGYDVSVSSVADNDAVRLIRATGYAPDNTVTSRAYEQRGVLAYAQINEESYFDFAVFAKDSMHINGNALVDSYDSRNGAYGGANIGSSGDIGTNSAGASTVDLNGNVMVNGDAAVGPSGDPSQVIDMTGGSTITGDQSALTKEKDYPAVTTDVVSQGPLSIGGNTTYTLASGTYHFSSLDIKGNGKLKLTGEAVIYVSGSVSIAGNGILTSGDSPPNLILYVTTADTVKISGNGDFFGGIYAPDSNVQVSGNGELYGAVVSNNYHQAGNGGIHFDEALIDTGKTGQSDVSMLSWWEDHTVAAN